MAIHHFPQQSSKKVAVGVADAAQPPSDGGYSFLAERKAENEAVKRRAIELANLNQLAEIIAVYRKRWQEIAGLRTNVSLDARSTAEEKATVDRVLKGEQDSISRILSSGMTVRAEARIPARG